MYSQSVCYPLTYMKMIGEENAFTIQLIVSKIRMTQISFYL